MKNRYFIYTWNKNSQDEIPDDLLTQPDYFSALKLASRILEQDECDRLLIFYLGQIVADQARIGALLEQAIKGREYGNRLWEIIKKVDFSGCDGEEAEALPLV